MLTNVILDMDGTLLEGYTNDYNKTIIKRRPHLMRFFAYLFEKMERVSIWTNGSKEWYTECFDRVLKHCIPAGKSFDFVVTFDDNLIHCKQTSPKQLQKIYDIHPQYTLNNTMLIDDSEHALQCDPFNSILIPTYAYDSDDSEEDCGLLDIIELIEGK